MYGESGDCYVLFGPVQSNSLYRVDTSTDIDPTTTMPDLRIRGEDWSYEITVNSEAELDAYRDQYRVEGRAEMLIDENLGRPALNQGDVDGDGTADLVFFAGTTLNVLCGGDTTTRMLTTDDVDDSVIMAGSFAPTQVLLIDSDGDGTDEILALRDAPASSDDTIVALLYNASGTLRGTIHNDLTNRQTHYDTNVNAQLSLNETATVAAGGGTLTAASLGDVNGDGCEDLLIGYQAFMTGLPSGVPNLGRAYLFLGGCLSGEVYLGGGDPAFVQNANYVWEHYALGAAAFTLGDLNDDGYHDFAFARGVESDSTDVAPGAVFVVAGSNTFSTSDNGLRYHTDQTASLRWYESSPGVDVVGLSIAHGTLAANQWAHGPATLTTGDFDGDGRADLAMGLPDAMISNSPVTPTTTDPDADRVFVFRGVELPKPLPGFTMQSLVLADADVDFTSEAGTATGFGTLPVTPGIDLNQDRVDDLLVGLADAAIDSAVSGQPTQRAGRVYFVYGEPLASELPDDAEPLANRDVPGSGLYVVEQATGQPFVTEQSLFGSGLLTAADMADPENELFTSVGNWTLDGDHWLARITEGSTVDFTRALYQWPVASRDRSPYVEIRSIITAGENGSKTGYIIFDYQDVDGVISFGYAGLDFRHDRWVIGQYADGDWGEPLAQENSSHADESLPWDVRVHLREDHVELYADVLDPLGPSVSSEHLVCHTFAPDDPAHESPRLTQGEIGLATEKPGNEEGTTEARFAAFSVAETERWFSFNTAGDGQIGDQVRVLMADSSGETYAISRPTQAMSADDTLSTSKPTEPLGMAESPPTRPNTIPRPEHLWPRTSTTSVTTSQPTSRSISRHCWGMSNGPRESPASN